jgi:hypothetical protein
LAAADNKLTRSIRDPGPPTAINPRMPTFLLATGIATDRPASQFHDDL